uniref:Uncharacterized protein n=1 Tax=Glossina pallidipes TaxID=7398 RepID=A0A1B0A9A4_GLOPL
MVIELVAAAVIHLTCKNLWYGSGCYQSSTTMDTGSVISEPISPAHRAFAKQKSASMLVDRADHDGALDFRDWSYDVGFTKYLCRASSRNLCSYTPLLTPILTTAARFKICSMTIN